MFLWMLTKCYKIHVEGRRPWMFPQFPPNSTFYDTRSQYNISTCYSLDLLQFAGSWLNLPFSWQLSYSNHNPDSVPLPSLKLTRLRWTERCGHLSLSSFQTWSHNCFSVGINSMISVWLVWRLWLKHLPHTTTSCFHPKILWTVRCLF